MTQLKFIPETHTYSTDDGRKWTSVTTVVSAFKKPFESEVIAGKVSKSKRSKWYGLTPKEIIALWDKEAQRACDLGNWYHDQREQDLLGHETIRRYTKDLPIIHPIFDEQGFKVAPSQKLDDGVYPELLVYLQSAMICGQSDLVEIEEGKVYITDYKTNKKIDQYSYVNWEGKSDKMFTPVSHLDDCNYNHYNLQLSLYMYMILKHNPSLEFGGLTIHHISFKAAGEDEYGFPIAELDHDANPIIEDIEVYTMPYLKDEVQNILKHIKDNPEVLKKKK